MNSRVGGVEFGEVSGVCTVILRDGRSLSADLVVGAVGINSVMREYLAGRPDNRTKYGIGSRVEGVRDRSAG